MEVSFLKVLDTAFKVDSNGILREIQYEAEMEDADISDETRIKYALQRRGLALHVAQLMSWPKHEALVKKMMKEWNKKPVHGYAKVRLDQIYRADIEVFNQLAAQTEDGLAPPGDGTFILDQFMDGILKSWDFRNTMNSMPYAVAAPAQSQNQHQQKTGNKRSNGKTQREQELENQIKRLKANAQKQPIANKGA